MDTRHAFIARLGEAIDRIERKFREIEVEARIRRIAAEAGYRQASDRLRRQLRAARERLASAWESADGSWEELRSGLERTGDELRRAFEIAYQRLRLGRPP